MNKGRIGIESGFEQRVNYQLNTFLKLRSILSDVEFVDASDIIWGQRVIKSPAEIECHRRACQATGYAHDKIFDNIEAGMSEREISMTSIAADNVEDPGRVSDALDKIRHSSDHLLTLINDILDLNRIESGKMTIAREPTDIRATIDQCAEVLKGSAINRDLKIITDTERIEYPFVLTDALHIRQILINIISNAVKFTPDGGSITFRADGRRDESGDTLLCRFEVADTGIGMTFFGVQVGAITNHRVVIYKTTSI